MNDCIMNDCISYDEANNDCIDNETTSSWSLTKPIQERTERYIVNRKRLDSNCCDICRQRCKDFIYVVPVDIGVQLIYCEDCYNKRSDYVKKLEEEYKELCS